MLKNQVALLVLTASLQGANSHEIQLLKYHVELAAEASAYVHLMPEGAVIFVKGIEVKRLPAHKSMGLLAELRTARVERISAVGPLPEVVVEAEEIAIDPAQTVSSVEDIVTVQHMPATFVVVLDDGSQIWVESEEPAGFISFFQRKTLGLKVLCSYWISKLLGRPVRLVEIQMDPASARQFFWILEERTGVIY